MVRLGCGCATTSSRSAEGILSFDATACGRAAAQPERRVPASSQGDTAVGGVDEHCAQNCAQTTSKRGHPGPTRSIEMRELRPKTARSGWVGLLRRGLANHRLQPLGHLTAARFLSIRQGSSYGNAGSRSIVPDIVPASSRIQVPSSDRAAVANARQHATVLFRRNLPSKWVMTRGLYA